MSSRVDPFESRSHTEISMLRVLLVLEDYGELMFLQTVLKKIGFDVDAIQNPRSFADSVLRMNPDLLVMTAYGKRVNGLDLNKNLRRQRGTPHTILLRSPGMMHEPDPLVAGWLDSPVAAALLLDMIGDVCGLNKQILQEKLKRLNVHEHIDEKGERQLVPLSENDEPVMEKRTVSGNFNETDEMIFAKGEVPPKAWKSPSPLEKSSGTLAASTMPSQERAQRYQKFLQEQKPAQKGFTVKDVQDKVRELRKHENPENMADLERERKLFVEHLFKKKAD